jgi:hypothetical protein
MGCEGELFDAALSCGELGIAAVSCGSPLVSQCPPAEALDVAEVPAEHIYTTQGSLAVREHTYTTQGSLAVREHICTTQGSLAVREHTYTTQGSSLRGRTC